MDRSWFLKWLKVSISAIIMSNLRLQCLFFFPRSLQPVFTYLQKQFNGSICTVDKHSYPVCVHMCAHACSTDTALVHINTQIQWGEGRSGWQASSRAQCHLLWTPLWHKFPTILVSLFPIQKMLPISLSPDKDLFSKLHSILNSNLCAQVTKHLWGNRALVREAV